MVKEKKKNNFMKVSNQRYHKNLIHNDFQKREKSILLLMKEYNISYDNAKRVVLELEERGSKENDLNILSNSTHHQNSKNSVLNQTNVKSKIQHDNIGSYPKEHNFNSNIKRRPTLDEKLVNESNTCIQKSNFDNVELNIQKQKKELNEFEKQHLKQQKKLTELNLTNSNSNSLLSDLMSDYDNSCVVELKNVSLTFDVDKERVDTLKEKFIRTLKHDNNKKMHIHALKNVSFKIYKGEKIGIIGYNGAGKSTLLKVISGIFAPDSGTVNVEGNISPLLSLGAGFDFNYSGRKNIYLNGSILGYDKKFLEEKIDNIIEFSELGEYIDIPIKNYSSGMLAKLGFSIAAMLNPEILIIDEILGVGDVNFRRKSADKIKSLMNNGCTVILVSHSIPQIRELCDKAIWIDNGYLKEIGEVNQVCDNYMKNSEKASKEQLKDIQLT